MPTIHRSNFDHARRPALIIYIVLSFAKNMYTHVYVLGPVLCTRAIPTRVKCVYCEYVLSRRPEVCVYTLFRVQKKKKTRFDFFLQTLLDVFTAIVHNIYYIYMYIQIYEDNYKQSRKCETRFLFYSH